MVRVRPFEIVTMDLTNGRSHVTDLMASYDEITDSVGRRSVESDVYL